MYPDFLGWDNGIYNKLGNKREEDGMEVRKTRDGSVFVGGWKVMC